MVDRDAMLVDADRYGELDRRRRIELRDALTVVLWLGLARPDRRNGQGLTEGSRWLHGNGEATAATPRKGQRSS
jgi:hypothetical protein